MSRRVLVVFVLALGTLVAAAAHAAEYPIADATVQVRWAAASKRAVLVKGRWQGAIAGGVSALAGARLRIAGGPGEGGTTTIALADGAWRALGNGRGFRYADATGSAGGIRAIVLKNARAGRPGTLRIVGGKPGFAYGHRALHSRVRATLEVGLDRWCAEVVGPSDADGRVRGTRAPAPASCPPELVVDAGWLAARLGRPEVQVVDTRAAFGGGHVPGAIALRPEQLAATRDGVDLQVMTPAQAEPVLSAAGLRRDATVVVYGAPPEYDPARLVWVLAHLGHPDVRYLDGGFAAWVGAAGAVTPGSPPPASATTYAVDAVRASLRTTGAEVLAGLGAPPYASPAFQLADARTLGEYTSGHVPTAVFAPWGDTLSGGLLRARDTLEDAYAALGLDPTRPTVAYCLVGWRASVAWLALTWLGWADVRVYDGSWLEWGAGGYPVETGA